MSEIVFRRVVVHGRVQGVGFRDWTKRSARRHGIEGWVRNRTDGGVEALFAGSPGAVAAMIEACRNGPPGAAVTSIEEQDAAPSNLALRRAEEGFSVLGTV